MKLFNRNLKDLAPYAVLIGVCLIFFYKTLLQGHIPFPGDLLLAGYSPWSHESYSGYVAGTVPTKNQYFDVIRELYPWKTVVTRELKEGRFPLWNPYNFSGAPLLANYQSQALYPFTFLYLLFPQATAWTVMVIIQPIMGTIFLYLFATRIGLSAAAAVLAAILFNFSSFANVWMEFTTIWQTILWLPFLLYLVERAVKQNGLSVGHQLLFIFGLFAAITAGHPQDFIHVFLFLVVYTLFRVKNRVLLVSPFLYLYIIPFLIAAPQILPTIELFVHSARVAHDYQGIITRMLVQAWQLPLLAVADFFGNPATRSNFTGDYVGKTLSVGIVGLFLAGTALWDKQKNWHKIFFTTSAVVTLLLTVRTPLSELLYRYPWPILSTGAPTRVLFILMLAFSMLAGYGFDVLYKNIHSAKTAIVTMWSLLALLWAFIFMHPPISGLTYTADAVSVMTRAMILATGILTTLTAVVVFARYKKIALILLIPLATAELLYSFLKFNPFVPASYVFPENKLISALQSFGGIDRFWGYGTAAIEANFATQAQLFSPDGTDPLNLSWYNRFLQSSRDGNIAVIFGRTTRSDAQIAPGYGESDLPANEYRLRMLDALGVKYVLDRSENPQDGSTYAPSRFSLLAHIDEWTIYENKKAAPRFFLTHDVRPYQDALDFEKQFFAPDFAPDQTVLVEREDTYSLPQFVKGENEIALTEYAPTTVTFRVSSEETAFLFLSDTFDNGWTGAVNGKPVRIYRADYAFRGVIVPKGDSIVTFTYRPKSFDTGIAISVISLIALAGFILIHGRMDKKI